MGGHKQGPQDAEAQSFFTAITTYMGYIVLTVFGHIRDTFGKVTGITRFRDELIPRSSDEAPLVDPQGNLFYVRRLKFRIQDCFDRPIDGRPGAYIDVMDRSFAPNGKNLVINGKTSHCLNLGSYNYLGFADDWDNSCGKPVRDSLSKYGPSCMSAASDAGYMDIHDELERFVAHFVGKQSAVVFNMGYGTNSTAIPALVGKGSLIISDKLNHTSLVNGCRVAGGSTRAFEHNDMEELERVIRLALVEGQPTNDGSHKHWAKIIIMVEGIYSMEGEVCKLKQVVEIAKRYKCYTYVDEAHSIGALGASGRGVCESTGVDPADIDVLMGTFTKSFGGMGGYIAGDESLIRKIRSRCMGVLCGSNLSPVVAQQVLTSFQIIAGLDGTTMGRDKLKQIKDNSNYFRNELKRIGCSVLGDEDSPVIPVMLFNPTKIPAFSRECLKRNLAVVVVGYPAVPVYGARVRFCISAAHTREDLKSALKKIREVCKILNIRYEKSMFG